MSARELTPFEAVRVAAFGLDRPEQASAGDAGAAGPRSVVSGPDVSPGGADASTGRTEPDVLMAAKLVAIRLIHTREEYGDCIEDGDPYPCGTVQILDWEPA